MKQDCRKEIVLFEEMSLNAHVALKVMHYDGWILKFSDGYTNRSNSVSMLYPSTIDLEDKIEYCEKVYAEQNLPCVFKLTDGDEKILNILTERGYKEVTPTDIMIRSADDLIIPDCDITFYKKPAEEWLTKFYELEGVGEKHQTTYRRMLDKVCLDTTYVAIKNQGKIVAVASSAMERGYMIIQNVVVHPDYRRKGYGKMLCTSLISKGKSEGASTVWLQVVQSNEGAYKLYEGLGFKKIYSYRYLKK